MQNLNLLTQADLAKELGVTLHSIYAYEDYGLIKAAVGVKHKARYYDKESLEFLKKVRKLTYLYSLAQIKTLKDTNKIDEGLKQVEILKGGKK